MVQSANRLDVLRLKFDDVARGITDDDIPFDPHLARQVADFVIRQEPDVRIVAHCFAGLCRSAGIVAGIAGALGDGGVAEECHRRYIPNILVEELTRLAMSAGLRKAGVG